jgi:hypothetical protein
VICAICGEEQLQFEPSNPHLNYCQTCDIAIERCCYTFQLITETESSTKKCFLCGKVSAKEFMEIFAQVSHDIHASCYYCPFCCVRMKAL